MAHFTRTYHGWKFSKNGSTFAAVVEYASSQSIPHASIAADSQEGTIFEDDSYKQFLQELTEGPQTVAIEEETNDIDSTSTPLLEFLKIKKGLNRHPSREKTPRKKSSKKEKKDKSEASARVQVETVTPMETQPKKLLLKKEDSAKAVNETPAEDDPQKRPGDTKNKPSRGRGGFNPNYRGRGRGKGSKRGQSKE